MTIMNSNQSMDQQFNPLDCKSSSLTVGSSAAHDIDGAAIEPTESDPTATTLAAVVSGGVAGAAIGHLVGGKVGLTIGAVVGGVAGAAIGNEGGKLPEHIGGTIIGAVKEAPERLKMLAADRLSDDEAAWTADPGYTDVGEATLESNEAMHENLTAVKGSTISAILPAKTHFHLGVALGRQGKLAESIDEFQQALRLASKSAETHYNLGIALIRRGDKKQALEHLRQASKLCLTQGKMRGAKIVDRVIRSLNPERTYLQY